MVDFPEPDSPTTATVWPAHDGRSAPRTAGVSVAEPDFQALDRQQRRIRCVMPATLGEAGSSASRKASPIIMNASTVTASAPAG